MTDPALQQYIRGAFDPAKPVAVNVIDFGSDSDRATWEAVAQASGGTYQNLSTSGLPGAELRDRLHAWLTCLIVKPVNRGFWRKNGLKNGARIYLPRAAQAVGLRQQQSRGCVRVFNKWLINQHDLHDADAASEDEHLQRLSLLARPCRSGMERAPSARPIPALQERLPRARAVVDLFKRTETGDRRSPKSTLLFPHFAQWFVDGFLRTDPKDCKKNSSTHDIDLSQLYGQTVEVTKMLRLYSETERGRLKCQLRDGQEFPPYYFDEDGNPKVGFEKLEIVIPRQRRHRELARRR